MKPEDFVVGGLYEWRKDIDWHLESTGGVDDDGDEDSSLNEVGPFLVTSITDEVLSGKDFDECYTLVESIGPSGRTYGWEIRIARFMQPFAKGVSQ